MMRNLKISDISKLFNIPISALRYYEKEGLCQFKRSDNRYRWADMRTIRNLCDISFYRKLSCSIEEIHELSQMNYEDISGLLKKSRKRAQEQIWELERMIQNIDEKVDRICRVDDLSGMQPQVVKEQLPAIREFDLFRNSDISNLIQYEKTLFIVIDPQNAQEYHYGVIAEKEEREKELIHPQDSEEKAYLKILLRTDYERIEENNLQQYYDMIKNLGCQPGRAYGKVLVSACNSGTLCNYYEAWIEMNEK